MARRILVIEDEPMVAEVIERYLRRDGYDVDVCHDGLDGWRVFGVQPPDLVVLDLMLPGIDGLDLCERIRDAGTTPVIILTARDREVDKVRGLSLGADDYVTKPFSPRELTARVEAVLRRARPIENDRAMLRCGELTLDPDSRTVELAGAAVGLTSREFDLLHHFMRHVGRVFTREQLIEAIWSHDFDGDEGTVTVHLRRLRTKIEADPSRPQHLKTVWGVGYRFEA